jgi:succinate dehydrogenase flavin-adding protein (antitoxin of CptAB toxin-antitoxin module)
MRELDELLLDYLEHSFDAASDDEKAAFRTLLELSDPELMAYLLKNEEPQADIRIAVDAILQRAEG